MGCSFRDVMGVRLSKCRAPSEACWSPVKETGIGGRPKNLIQTTRAVTHKANASHFGRRQELEASMSES
jgi:hypothetical protein